MKKILLTGLLLSAVLLPAPAAVYNYSGPAYGIPDGNPNGTLSSIAVSGAASALTDVSVTLSFTGGYNGDLYAYLSYNNVLVPLLNRIGVSSGNPFGSAGAGMNVTLSDSAAGNIHAASGGVLIGTFRADGQNISPLSAAGAFNPNGGAITLDGTFGGLNPNGTWTLFVCDAVSGGGSATLNSWSLNVVAIPEPDVRAIVLMFLALTVWHRRKTGKQPAFCPVRSNLRSWPR